MTPEIFFKTNCKWFAIAFLLLFLVKGIQSCNRNNIIESNKVQYKIESDSLKQQTKIYEDSIKILQFDIKLANQGTMSANERAAAVQSAAEKIKANTTVIVKGVEKN